MTNKLQDIQVVINALPLMVGGQFLTSQVNSPWDMMGPRYKKERQALMSALIGRKAKATESGVTNLCKTLCDMLGTRNEFELSEAIKSLRMERSAS